MLTVVPAIAPWGALSRGQFRDGSKAEDAGRKPGPLSDEHRRINETLAELAANKKTLPTSIALAYLTHKAPYVFPVVGGRKIEHLQANIEAMNLHLTEEEIRQIERVAPFDFGQPLAHVFGGEYHTHATASDIPMIRAVTRLESVPPVQVSIPESISSERIE